MKKYEVFRRRLTPASIGDSPSAFGLSGHAAGMKSEPRVYSVSGRTARWRGSPVGSFVADTRAEV